MKGFLKSDRALLPSLFSSAVSHMARIKKKCWNCRQPLRLLLIAKVDFDFVIAIPRLLGTTSDVDTEIDPIDIEWCLRLMKTSNEMDSVECRGQTGSLL